MGISDGMSDVCSSYLHVVATVSGQCVSAGRADDILDAVEAVAFGVAAGGGIGCKIDRHAIRRAGIACRVRAAAADQCVRAGTTDQRVIAIAAITHVIARITGECVEIGRAPCRESGCPCVELWGVALTCKKKQKTYKSI